VEDKSSTLTGLRQTRLGLRRQTQPRWGCRNLQRTPRVARASQPWALRRNPVGINYARQGHYLVLCFVRYQIYLFPERERKPICLRAVSGSDCVKTLLGYHRLVLWGVMLAATREVRSFDHKDATGLYRGASRLPFGGQRAEQHEPPPGKRVVSLKPSRPPWVAANVKHHGTSPWHRTRFSLAR
jgi:hypothetical protein